MQTITPHLALATMLAARHLGYMWLYSQAQTFQQAVRAVLLAAIMLIVTMTAVLARTVQWAATILVQYLRAAIVMTLYVFCALIAVMVIEALLAVPR